MVRNNRDGLGQVRNAEAGHVKGQKCLRGRFGKARELQGLPLETEPFRIRLGLLGRLYRVLYEARALGKGNSVCKRGPRP